MVAIGRNPPDHWRVLRIVAGLAGALFVGVIGMMSFNPAFAQTDSSTLETMENLVTDCDRVAADPHDPQRMARGVAGQDLIPRLVVAVCRQQVERSPKEPRFLYQLGRAYLKQGDHLSARNNFVQAAQADHVAAWAALADFFRHGWTFEQDMPRAIAYYQQAVDGGYLIARRDIAALTFDPDIFASELVGQIFEGDQPPVIAGNTSHAGRTVRAYLYGLYAHVAAECGQRTSLEAVSASLSFRLDGTPDTAVTERAKFNAVQAHGAEDGARFVRRHACEGPIAERMFARLAATLNANAAGR